MNAHSAQSVALLVALVACQYVLWWATRPKRRHLYMYGGVVVAAGLLGEFADLRWAIPVGFSVASVPMCIGAVLAVREWRAARSERA